MRKGWFKLPTQDGDRTPEEQLLGLDPALALAKGATVLDLGCAEGVISQKFAAAGALEVLGVELLQDHVNVARKVCKLHPQVDFICAELGAYITARPAPRRFDIVLMLSIAHKLSDPGLIVTFAGKSTGKLLAFRGPNRYKVWDGTLRSKFGVGFCHVPALLKAQGLTEGQTIEGARGECVQYWHRS